MDSEAKQTQEVDERSVFWGRKKKKRIMVEPPTPPLEAPIADTHAHLDMLDNVSLALARAAYYNVQFICAMADVADKPKPDYDDLETWKPARFNYDHLESWKQEAAEILEDMSLVAPGQVPKLPHVRIIVGCHPHNAKEFTAQAEAELMKLLAHPLTCAIGEVGLDYHYDLSPRPTQQAVFRKMIELSHTTELPLVLHLREAHEDAYKILQEEGFPKAGTLLHCFNRDVETVRPWLDAGCMVAVGGALTFKKSEETREAIENIPSPVLLTETDAPFMTPEPMRSAVCEPAHTIFTAAKIAELKRCAPGPEREALLQRMYNNALALLDRPTTAWQASYKGE